MSKILILHGWTYQTDTWQPLIAALKERGLDPEMLLVPGLTDGTNPIWTLDDYVAWLKEKAAAHERVILIGHSNGGRISLAFAAKYPEKVERLILLDSAGIPSTGLRALKRRIFKVVAKAGRSVTEAEWLRKLIYKLARVNDYSDATPEMKRTMANLISADLGLVLDRIQAPTLIIWGANDTVTPLRDGEVMHRGIRGSRLVVIPEARHSPHVTHTQQLAGILAEELKR